MPGQVKICFFTQPVKSRASEKFKPQSRAYWMRIWILSNNAEVNTRLYGQALNNVRP